MRYNLSLIDGCQDEMILRELCSYDIQCPECCEFVPKDNYSKNLQISNLGLTSLHWSRQYEYTWAIQHSNLNKEHICLEAGGAYAVFKYALAKRCKKVVCIDINQDYLDKAIKSSQRLGFSNIEFENSFIQKYKTEQKFDRIYCLSVLEHIENKNDRIDCLKNMFGLLKSGGELYLSFDFVVQKGSKNYDFYIDQNEACELLKFLGINNFVEVIHNKKLPVAEFDGGCFISAVCIKFWDI